MKKILYRFIFPLCVAVALQSCGGGSGSSNSAASTICGQPGSRCTGNAGGLHYILYTPANFKQNTSALVMALHPRSDSAERMETLTRLNAKADQAGFAVLYPETGGRWWNWFFRGGNDSQSLRTIIETVQVNLKADPKRIYATGYSDGAEMAHRVGVELGDIVAAIAPVSGVLNESYTPAVMPGANGAVAVLILHADLPPAASFYVCGYDYGGYKGLTQDEAFDYWAGPTANNCSTLDTTEKICSLGSLHLTKKQATNCKGTTQVLFYQLLNVSHAWFNVPGNWSVPMNIPPKSYYVGTNVALQQPYHPAFDATTGVTANDIIWNFFSAHPKP